jgi:hypothetical protein
LRPSTSLSSPTNSVHKFSISSPLSIAFLHALLSSPHPAIVADQSTSTAENYLSSCESIDLLK